MATISLCVQGRVVAICVQVWLKVMKNGHASAALVFNRLKCWSKLL